MTHAIDNDFAVHLATARLGRQVLTSNDFTADDLRQAMEIHKDPARHIQALVNAGILKPIATNRSSGERVAAYEAVLPHVHRWTVFFAKSDADTLTLMCDSSASCNAYREIPNRSPFVVED
jgi:hypothetical protein